MIMMIVIKTNPTRPPGLPTSNSKIVKVKDDATIVRPLTCSIFQP